MSTPRGPGSGRPDEPVAGLIEGILQQGATGSVPNGDASELLTFLIADVRGYTRFTQERGDEAAAKLTAKFAMVVRDVVPRFGGTVFEVRGDEALCVFASPRQSLRAAVALQQRFVEETADDAALPLTVGVGVDVGEAVRVADGYRGGALNLAARLCGQAKAGEVLASSEVTHLARTIDGIRYVVLDRRTVKGLGEPVQPVRVLPEGEDPTRQLAALLAAAAPPRQPVRRPWLIAAGAALLAAIVAVGVVVAGRHDSGGHALTALSENSLGVIDPDSGRIVGQVAVGAGPTAVAAGYGSIWTANTDDNTVSRVDPATREVTRTISVGTGPAAIATGLHGVWVVNSVSASVSRIDPTTNQAIGIPVGTAPRGVVVAHGSVWVTNSGNGTVSRIDPNRNEIVETISVGAGPSGIAAGRDIWVANSTDNTVTRIDGTSHVPAQPVGVGSAPKGIAVFGKTVWVSNNLGASVTRIRIAGSADPENTTIEGAPTQIALVDGHPWVALQTAGLVTELDPGSARVARTVRTGPSPGGITAARGKLWVTTTIDPARHRGGAVHIVGGDPLSLDPLYVQNIYGQSLVFESYDGLVAFAHEAGAGSTAIVPDLATTIPQPTNGGRTYTFQLRSGIRWSTGAPVTVLDVRRGLERAIAAGPFYSTLWNQIVGWRSCSPRRCVASGIVVDSSAGTVAITLVRPNGNFIDDLVGAYAVPASRPLSEDKARAVPATGPYRIARYDPGKLIVLDRNRYFRQWSAAAQPAGFPDRIEWRIDPKANDDDNKPAMNAVADGRADWTLATLPHPEARFGDRVHYTPQQRLHALFLNTRIPPFNDVRVRRALALALDRRAIAHDWYFPGALTCQYLSPNISGFRPYCPYTLGTDDTGQWRAPDYPRALQLVRESGTRGAAVTVWSTPQLAPALRRVVSALIDLGYDAHLAVSHLPLFTGYFPFVADSRNHVQAAFEGGIILDATPANMLDSWRCSAYQRANGAENLNPSGFCDRAYDRLLTRARRVEASSLAAANNLWAQADRLLVDKAPWIPLVNPVWVDVTSARVHNFKRSTLLGVLLDQMWVR